MKKMIIILLMFVLLASSNILAQDSLDKNDVKTKLTKIFDLSKDQNYGSAASLFLNNKNDDLRAFNYEDKSEAKAVKRMVKKIKAYLDLSDSYEYESIEFAKLHNLPSADIKVNFKSGDQILTISFIFVQHSNNILLAKFK